MSKKSIYRKLALIEFTLNLADSQPKLVASSV